jgi:O-antigen ligase
MIERVRAPGAATGMLAALLLTASALGVLPLSSALAVGGGALAAGALLVAPELAVYFIALAVPFGSLVPLEVGGLNATAADLFLAVAWGLYVMRGIARRKVELRAPALTPVWILFLLAAGLSVTVARSLTDGLAELAKWVEMFAAYWLVSQFFSEKQVVRLLAVMFCAGLAEALLGAYQYYFRVGPDGFLLFGGANLRAYGTFEQPNPYAGYLGLILPLAWGTGLGMLVQIAVWRRGGSRDVLPLAALAVGASAAMLAALFFSYSRGAWIGVAAALAVTTLVVVVRSRRALTFAVMAGLVGLLVVGLGELALVPNIVAERFATVGEYLTFEDVRGVRANDENFALVERRAHWQAAWGMFEDSPWVGVGLGNYAVEYARYALPKWDDPLGHAHNYYLNVLAEAGGIGFLAYMVLWGAVFLRLGRAAFFAGTWKRGVLAGAFGALVALSIHNLFDNLFVHAMYLQVGLTLGLAETAAFKETGKQ